MCGVRSWVSINSRKNFHISTINESVSKVVKMFRVVQTCYGVLSERIKDRVSSIYLL